MSEPIDEIMGGLVVVVVGCFFIFTFKGCVIESQKLDNEKLRIQKNCPHESTPTPGN